jgi:uncharacterized membrane protein
MLDDRLGPNVGGFRHRGHHHVSRIESFSDAVFGFSLTLLVVSLSVPRTFDELLHAMAGFPGFAVSFALLAQIWYYQYRFFRRYALADRVTIVLNITLLFMVVFYTYPLKFLFGSLTAIVSGAADVLRPDQIWQLFAVYGGGYAAIFALFALLNRHALAKRADLGLSPLEVLQTQLAVRINLLQVGIALLSIGIAWVLTSLHQWALAGFCGGLIYPVGITLGAFALARSSARARQAALADEVTAGGVPEG